MDPSAKHNARTPFDRLVESPNLALREIYARYRDLMRRSVIVLLDMNEVAVEELIWETLEVVREKAEEVMACEKPLGWMLRVLQLKALNRARKKRMQKQVSLDEVTERSGGDWADENLKYQELMQLIMDATELLTPREKEVFLQVKVEERSIKDVMEMYDMAEQTVKNTLSRALSKIREHLKRVMADN